MDENGKAGQVPTRHSTSIRGWVAAVILLVVAVVVGYAATFLPYDQAMSTIYTRPWFAAIFVAFAAALVMYVATCRRRSGRVALLLIHVGVLVIILGGFVTFGFAIRGTLVIEEGKSADSFALDDLRLSATLGGEEAATSLGPFLNDEDESCDLDARMPIASGRIVVSAERYVPNPKEVLPRLSQLSEDGCAPAIELTVERNGRTGRLSLLADDPMRSRDSFEGLEFEFIFVADKDKYSSFLSGLAANQATEAVTIPRPPRERLVISSGDAAEQTIELAPGDAKVGYTARLRGREGQIRILRYLPDFEMGPNMQARSRSNEPNNPAIQVEARIDSITSTVWLFGKIAAFHKPSLPGGISITYSIGASDQTQSKQGATKRIVLLSAPQEPYAVISGTSLQGQARLGESIEIDGDSTARVIIEQFFSNARETFEVIEGEGGRGDIPKCVRVAIWDASGKLVQRIWAPEDTEIAVPTPQGEITLLLFTPSRPLGFELFLEKFEARKHPGSRMPSAYISTVKVTDKRLGTAIDYTISPNHPLARGGYKLYQSAFDKTDEGAFVSILGVSRDPGATGFYIGSICLILGLLLRFYLGHLRIVRMQK
ncbi:cytochrome c biogenesis protein ResB [bacterium]|nr:cytochrome c biogenesis protein ResB [bacterium]